MTASEPTPAAKDEKQLSEWQLYLRQIPGLWAGREVPVSNIKRVKPAAVTDADDTELRLLIELAQRQLDALSTQLEQIRQRAQFLFTTALVLVGLGAAILPVIATEGGFWPFTVWTISFVVLTVSLLGTAGIVVNKKIMGVVDSGWVTRQARPWLQAVAEDHIESVQPSWETVATQVTLLRDSALLTILSAFGLGGAWFWAVL